MRIGIDARLYGPRQRGLGRYVQELVDRLQRLDCEHEYRIFLRKENWDAFEPKNPKFQKVLADARWYTAAEQFKMPGIIRKQGIDLMHYPHFNVPIRSKVPFVMTIHDLLLLRHPSPEATTLPRALYGFKRRGYVHVIKKAVSRARHIMAVSEFTKKEIRDIFGTDPAKISVTYEAAANIDRAEPGKQACDAVLGKLGIKAPFIMYVGSAYPHKNLKRLLQAFAGLRKQHAGLMLVLVGRKDIFYERLEKHAAENGLDMNVEFAGFVPDDDLDSLYATAQAYAFPSYYEGFGLPPLEAMARGLPVAAARASCLPEVLGDAAAYFDPQDTDSMARTLDQLLTDQTLRQEIADKGARQASKYSWDRLARQTLRVYNEEKPKAEFRRP